MGIVPSVVSIFTGGLLSSSSSKPQEPVKFMNISVFNDPMASYINELSHPSTSTASLSEQNNDVLIYGSIAILILYVGLS
jgi:hypothetical protein